MNPWKRRLRTSLAAAAFTVLGGCGGGDVPDLPSPSEVYDIASFLLVLLTGNGTWTLYGVDDNGAPYEVSITFRNDSGLPFPFDGEVGDRSIESITIRTADGTVVIDFSESTYFDAKALAIRGTSRSDGTCSQVKQQGALPSDAKRGSSGSIAEATNHAGCSAATAVTGTTTNRWSIETEFARIYLCNTRSTYDLSGLPTSTGKVCVQPGSSNKFLVAWPVPGGGTVTARN